MEEFQKNVWTQAAAVDPSSNVELVQRTLEWAATRNVAPRIRTGPKGPGNRNGAVHDSRAPMRDSNEAPRSIGTRTPGITKKQRKKEKAKEKRAVAKKKETKDGFTRVGRQEYRADYGCDTVVTGAENTCLPDALVAACAAMGTLPTARCHHHHAV